MGTQAGGGREHENQTAFTLLESEMGKTRPQSYRPPEAWE